MNLGKIADIIGIIGFFGAIIAGIWGAAIASQLMIIISIIYLFSYLVIKVWMLNKENKRLHEIIERQITSKTLCRYFDESIWISYSWRNQQQIDSGFLSWDRCTVMLWVLVPEAGINLTDAPDNRYIFSHHTGEIQAGKNLNAFHFRYSSAKTWQVILSNDKGDYSKHRLNIDDGLEQGWHQFIISWDKIKPEMVFLIDGGPNGRDRTDSFLPFYPQKHSENLTVGAWVTPYPTSFCETKLANLWVYDGFLT